MEPLSVALEAKVQNLEQNITKGISLVQGFGDAAAKLPAVRPKFEDTISRTLNDLTGKFRVAQGNAEIFGNQLEADRLKVVAMQQALNQLLSAGLSPTSKEVLKLADDIESLSAEITKAEKAASRADLFASFQKTGKIIPDLEAKAQRLRTAMRNATDVKDIERYQKRLQAVNNELGELQQRGRQAASGMNNLAGSAGTVNMEFARIIQDAPYGMMGIGNNIQQLTANFGQLAQQAGGTGKAIKAALASMITPASLLTLGIAAVTSGWVVYQEWSRKSAKATEEAAKAMKSSREKADEYAASLQGITKVRLEGARSAQQELVQLRVLYGVTQDTTISIEKRKKAVDALQKEYPSYFGKLKDEAILTGKAKDEYDKLSKSILATARSRAAMKEIEGMEGERLSIIRQISDKEDEINRVRIANAKRLHDIENSVNRFDTRTENPYAVIDRERKRGQEELNKLIAEKGELERRNNAIYQDELKLHKYINREVEKGADLTDQDKTKKKVDKVAEAYAKLRREFNISTEKFLELGNSYDVFGDKARILNTAIKQLTAAGISEQSKAIKELTAQWLVFQQSAEMPQLKTVGEVKFKPITNAKDWGQIDFKIYSQLVDANRVARESIMALGYEFNSFDYNLLNTQAQLRNVENAIHSAISEGMSSASPRVAELTEKLKKLRDELAGNLMKKGDLGSISSAVDVFFDATATKMERLRAVGALAGETFVNAFSSLGQNLGDMFQGLASGADVLAGVGRALLQTMSQIAAEFGKKLLAIGVGETLMKIPTGPAKIAAGAALIAVAGIGGSFAGGRTSAAPSVSTSSISGTASAPMGISYEGDDELRFRIEGNDLVAVMDRANYKTRRTRG